MSKTVAVIDYGMGNLHSIAKALEHADTDSRIVVTADRDTILSAGHVVFPGVGAMRDCIHELQRLEMTEVVKQAAAERPFLGICLGMQAMLDHSEENNGVDALGLIPGNVRYFGHSLHDSATGEILKVPHMGWNQVSQLDHVLWKGIADRARFYFVHSYFAEPDDAADTAGTSGYGYEFTAAIARDNMFGVQFHPEKSQTAGIQLLANFLSWNQ